MIARGKTKAAETGKAAAPTPTASPTPQLDAMVKADPDLVERIFDYAVKLMPQIVEHGTVTAEDRAVAIQALRDEFAGERAYVRKRGEVDPLVAKVLSVYNGRNATETARVLGISRTTVYRKLKQPGRKV